LIRIFEEFRGRGYDGRYDAVRCYARRWGSRARAIDGCGLRPAVRGALAADDATERQGGEPKFKVRDTPDWKKHAADLEGEMLKRGMIFEVIYWHEDQEKLPFG
jgi:hypothetical protein